MNQAKASFTIKTWKRSRWDGNAGVEGPGADLFQLDVSIRYTGDIEADGSIHYLLADNRKGRGSFVALEKVTGSVKGKSGSFVFQHTGTFDNGHVMDTLIVLPESGEGDLSGISGSAIFDFPNHLESFPITFNFEV